MTEQFSVLVAADVGYNSDRLGKVWIDSLVSNLTARGWSVHVLTREVDGTNGHDDIWKCGGIVVQPEDSDPEHLDEHGLLPRFRARTIIAEAEVLDPDVVLVQGLSLARYVAGSGRLNSRLWTVPLDRPHSGGAFSPSSFADLKVISGASARILVADEVQRSTIDSAFPAASSKVRLLPVPDGTVEGVASDELADVTALHIHEGLFSNSDVEQLDDFGQQLQQRSVIPRIYIHYSHRSGSAVTSNPSSKRDGSAADAPRDLSQVLRSLPGAVTVSEMSRGTEGWELIPDDSLARRFGLLLAATEGRTPIELRPNSEKVRSDSEHISTIRSTPDPFDEAVAPPLHHNQSEKLRLVIAGSDFKFAGDLIEAFLADDLFDVRFDVFKHHARAQPRASEPYLEWADVVLSEFAVQNAIWYSQNLAPHQTLIVHLHGYELLADWITELNIEKVSTIVVASEFYRQKAHQLRGWPLEKIRVIPNSVNHFDFDRPKYDDARFHLGLVGMVPILKRPDRALDLLESLLKIDSRYTLHIRGHAPWNYAWEWKKAAHQDAYRNFYTRVGEKPELLRAIAFEPFAPDMANWLRKIGWLLSPSSRETFHLAAIEGAMSGSIPLAWERDGARDIIGDQWTFTSTEQIRDFVLSNNASKGSHIRLADQAQNSVSKYRSEVVGQQWRSIVIDQHEKMASGKQSDVPSGIAGTIYREVDELVLAGEFDEAKGALDRHIPVTKDDKSRLKHLELFVRGLLALDSRRINLIPENSQPKEHSLYNGPLGSEFNFTNEDSGNNDQYVRISALNAETGSGRILTDPRIVVGAIGIVPFAYTAEVQDQQNANAALRTVAGAARSTSSFSGPVVTDVLEEYLDSRIAVAGALRFDRWVEIVASEIRDHLAEYSQETLLIDAPWHVALPAAIAAGRSGRTFVWAPPVSMAEQAVETLNTNPYSGDLIAQFVGLLISRAKAIVLPQGDTINHTGLSPLATIPNLVTAEISQASTGRADESPTLVFDSRLTNEIAAIEKSSGIEHVLGALNGNQSRTGTEPRALRIAFVAGTEDSQKLRNLSPTIDTFPLVDLAELSPSVDALIVDQSAVSEPTVIPGHGAPAERVRALFDLARTSGVVGIFNASTHVGGNRSISNMAEKADAVTGTSALLTVGLLTRDPNSITRVGSTSVVSDNSTEVFHALAAVGIGHAHAVSNKYPATTTQVTGTRDQNPARVDSKVLDLRSLKLAHSDGVSIIVATRLGADRLPTMLASVARQTMHSSRMELIIVHNGPDDDSEAVVNAFAAEHAGMSICFLKSEVEGASAARNIGIEAATREFITFLDDDDELESNYVLNMWLSAETDAIVAAPLRDVDINGVSYTDIPNNRRLANLVGRRTQLTRAFGLLGLNACKLIPTRVARKMQYPVGMRSGEDVAFMSQLLLHPLELIPVDTAPNSAYVRHRRPDSISRRVLTHDFAVDQRLAVISHLERVREMGPDTIEYCIRELQLDQLSFLARYVAGNPAEAEVAVEKVLRAGFPTPLLKKRYRTLHSFVIRLESTRI